MKILPASKGIAATFAQKAGKTTIQPTASLLSPNFFRGTVLFLGFHAIVAAYSKTRTSNPIRDLRNLNWLNP
jgi:hypothetical protein